MWMVTLLFWLIVGHCVADYPLQGDFLARAKNPKAPLPGVDWPIALAVHSMIHAGAVALLTGSLILGVGEFLLHFVIDHSKCIGLIDFREDQLIHVLCKVAFVGMLAVVQ